MLTGLAVLVSTSGVMCGLLPLIQISRMVRTRTSEGVSLGYVAGNLANAVIFGCYGIALGNLLIAFSNLLWVLTGGVMLAVAGFYRGRSRALPATQLETPTAATSVAHGWSEADTLIIRPQVAAA